VVGSPEVEYANDDRSSLLNIQKSLTPGVLDFEKTEHV
jgi:hypothetical protein